MKFSIRELFLVTVIVALVLGWGLDHAQMNHKMQGIMRLYDSAAERLNAIESSKPKRTEFALPASLAPDLNTPTP